MDKKKTKVVFGNIFEFVSDLNSVFKEPKKTDPFNMYFRIISGLKMSDETGIVKVIDGFKNFMVENSHLILNDQLKSIRSGTKILYGDNERIYISISKYINQSDDETLKVIREHLLNILKDTNPETEAINQLKTLVSANSSNNSNSSKGEKKYAGSPLDFNLAQMNIDTNSNEGKMLESMMGEFKNMASSMDTSKVSNPMDAMSQVMSSGFLPKMMGAINSSGSGTGVDPKKMIRMLYTAMGSMIPADDSPPLSIPHASSSSSSSSSSVPPQVELD